MWWGGRGVGWWWGGGGWGSGMPDCPNHGGGGIPLRGYMGGSESHFIRIELPSDLLPGVFGAMKWPCPTSVSPPDVARQII